VTTLPDVLTPVRTMKICPTGLAVSGVPTWEEWCAMGYQLQRCTRLLPWLLGDWLNIGEREFGENYTQALELTDRSLSTLQNYKYVAGRVESSRRREELSWTHHEIVASLPPPEQEAWLSRATEEGWGTQELRQQVRPRGKRIVLSVEEAMLVCEALADHEDPSVQAIVAKLKEHL